MGDANGSADEDDYHVNIVSYGHSNGPLVVPKEHQKLTFNVRDIPNPGASLRKKHTGLSARLSKELMASKEAQERLADMVKAVNARMDEIEEMEIVRPEPTTAKKGSKGARVEHQEDVIGASGTLVVGIVCEEGRHRSVAFAEELGHSLKRRDWRTTIDHRDLSGYVNDEPESPMEVTSPTAMSRPKTKKQKNQETRRRKTSQRGFLNDEED